VSWDGPANLLAAARVAASPRAARYGVLVVKDEQIPAAREARKVHTEASRSFATPEFRSVGVRRCRPRVTFRRGPTAPATSFHGIPAADAADWRVRAHRDARSN
jgi:L-asparaginase